MGFATAPKTVAGLVAAIALVGSSDASAKALIGDALPNVVQLRVDAPVGKQRRRVKLHELGRGLVVFSFYSKFCRPCRHELPALHRAVARVNKRLAANARVRVVVLVRDTPPPRRWRERLGKQTLWLFDRGGAARRAFVPRRWPCTYIAKNLRIRKINRGYGRGYERRVQRWLEQLAR